MKNPMKSVLMLSLLMASLFLNQSCVPEAGIENPEGLVAPELPPAETFLLPVNTFEQAQDLDGKTNDESYINFVHAGLNQ